MTRAPDRTADLQSECRSLKHELADYVLQVNAFRTTLHKAVCDASLELTRVVTYRPGKSSSFYRQKLDQYWQSFELFAERVTATDHQLSIPFELDEGLHQMPMDGATVRQWEDALDLLEVTIDTLKLGKQQRQYLLAVIELVDSTERLEKLKWPYTKGAGHQYYLAFRDLKRKVKHLGQVLIAQLQELGITSVNLIEGQYPPPELTRVIARSDDNTDDNVVVREIVAKGYFWRSKLLRKADVIVITKEKG